MTSNACLFLGGIVGAIGVAAGALGAHWVKDHLEPAQLQSFETAVRYQIIHALALLAVGLLIASRPSAAASTAAWLFVVGVILFSGGIFAWLGTGVRPIVHIVPVGGVALIAGWIALAVAALR